MRAAVVAAATALAVAGSATGCGGGSDGPTGNSNSSGADAAAKDPRLHTGPARARIEAMFSIYNHAIATRDYTTACARLAPESVSAMLAKLRESGLDERSCEDGLARIFKNAPVSQRKLLIHVAETARLRQIAVHGRSASVVWTATVTGKSVKFSHGARLVGGEWKFVDTGNGSPQSQ